MNASANTRIRSWYLKTYPADDLGEEIDPNVTFEDIFYALDAHRDVYRTIGVVDSIIRERVFAQLAKIMGTPYEYVFDQWLQYA